MQEGYHTVLDPLVEKGDIGLPGVAADQHIVALGDLRRHLARRLRPAVLGVAADVAGLLGVQDQVVVGGERDAGLRRHLGDACGNVEVDGLDDDGVDALGDDVLRLGDLGLRVVIRRLHQDLVARLLGGLLEEGHVSVEVAECRLLLQHEGDPLGGAEAIGLIVPDVVNPFFAPVVRGAEGTVRAPAR